MAARREVGQERSPGQGKMRQGKTAAASPNDTLPVITAISTNDRSKWRTICLFSSPFQLPSSLPQAPECTTAQLCARDRRTRPASGQGPVVVEALCAGGGGRGWAGGLPCRGVALSLVITVVVPFGRLCVGINKQMTGEALQGKEGKVPTGHRASYMVDRHE